jgi:hypothetical protein
MGPKLGITRLDVDLVIRRFVERILSVFDDAVQVGLIKLRTAEIRSLDSIAQPTY